VGSNFTNNSANQDGGAVFSNNNCADFMIIDIEGYYGIQTSYDKVEVKSSDSFHYIIKMIDLQPNCDKSRFWGITTPDMYISGYMSESNKPGVNAIPIIASKANMNVDYYMGCKNSVELFAIPVIEVPSMPCIFDHNIAGGNGGAIYFNTNNEFPIIINAVFRHNQAKSNGGAINLGTNNHGAVFVNVRLHRNTVGNSGGGMYFSTYNSGIQIHNSSFISNNANVAGGAISLQVNNGKLILLLL